MSDETEKPIESVEALPVQDRARVVAQEHANIESEFKRRVSREKRVLFLRKFWWLGILVVLLTGTLGVMGIRALAPEDTSLVTPAALSPPDPFPLTVTGVTPLVRENVGDGERIYDVLVTVENRSPDWAVESFSYEIQLFDTTGAVTGSKRGLSFVDAESQRRFGVFSVQSSASVVRASVLLDEIVPVSVDVAPSVPLAVADMQQGEELLGGGASVRVITATIQNNSLFGAQGVDVVAVVYNAQGVVVGINGTQIATLASGASQSVRLLWPDYPNGASRIEIEALTNPVGVAVQ